MIGLLLTLVGCTTTDVEPQPEVPTFRFAFAVVADPHVTPGNDHADRLRAAIAWIDDHAEDRGIELVLVAGDVSWGGGHDLALDALHDSPVPVAPIIGDNEIQFGEEQVYADAFADHYDALAEDLDGWVRPAQPVHNPEEDQDSWFQSFAFDHGGVRFIGCDWSPRVIDPLWGEMAFLHDFDGGTFRWLSDQLVDAHARPAESIVLLSHQPMFQGPGGFTQEDWDVLVGELAPVSEAVAMNLAGHLHTNGDATLADAGIDVHLTDATWDDVVTLRLVEVWATADAFSYVHELVVVPTP